MSGDRFNVGFAELGVEVVHHFASGVYAKETRIPAGRMLMQHAHPYAHLSILAEGSADVTVDGKRTRWRAPVALTIEAGIKHAIVAVSDVVWFCVHRTDETDPKRVDAAVLAA